MITVNAMTVDFALLPFHVAFSSFKVHLIILVLVFFSFVEKAGDLSKYVILNHFLFVKRLFVSSYFLLS